MLKSLLDPTTSDRAEVLEGGKYSAVFDEYRKVNLDDEAKGVSEVSTRCCCGEFGMAEICVDTANEQEHEP